MSASSRWAFAATVGVVSAMLAASALAACGGHESSSEAQWATGARTAPASSAGTASPGGGPRCARPTAPAGWGPLKVAEDFDGTTLDTSKWSTYNDPDGRVPRDPSRVTVGGGELRLTGGAGADGKDVSGGISSNTNLLYAHADVCFRVDKGSGYSAIVLLWPQSEKWPDDGEIDISEVNRGSRQSTNSFVHNHANNDRLGHTTYADFTQWHVMSVDWLPDHVTFYLDGKKQWTVGLDARTAPLHLVPTTSPMHLAIQFDQGCDKFVECRTKATPAKVVMHTDWVRIYAYEGA